MILEVSEIIPSTLVSIIRPVCILRTKYARELRFQQRTRATDEEIMKTIVKLSVLQTI